MSKVDDYGRSALDFIERIEKLETVDAAIGEGARPTEGAA